MGGASRQKSPYLARARASGRARSPGAAASRPKLPAEAHFLKSHGQVYRSSRSGSALISPTLKGLYFGLFFRRRMELKWDIRFGVLIVLLQVDIFFFFFNVCLSSWPRAIFALLGIFFFFRLYFSKPVQSQTIHNIPGFLF